jgi:DNA-binding SARP family transcriptional activator
MTAEIRLLGDVEVHVGEQQVDVGHSRQRCVLVALLAEPARVVSVERLIDRVWGDRLPRRPRNALYGYVSRLRAALGDEARITQQSRGYLLEVDPMAVDLHRFRALVRRARANEDDHARAALFDEACGLWRGNPFGSLNTPWLNGMRATVEAERFAAELDRTDVQLRLGGHTELLPRLQRWSEAHPLDERLAAQLMLALYHCGRQAEALDHYQRIRARLAEELGADPSPALQRLHLRALSADLTVAVAPSRQPVPQQLPVPPGAFVGRAAELAELGHAHGDPATLMISVIGGVGGVGKTWLALRWAHDNAERFPDGQLYVNLRGFEPTGQPVPWPAVVRGFLHALGVDPATVPADPDAQAALYRSTVAGRRMLVVLDNSRDTEQVIPLLPGSPTRCLGRHRAGDPTAAGVAVGDGAGHQPPAAVRSARGLRRPADDARPVGRRRGPAAAHRATAHRSAAGGRHRAAEALRRPAPGPEHRRGARRGPAALPVVGAGRRAQGRRAGRAGRR